MQRRATVAGYTLVEIIVALLVFTIGALALVASGAVVGRGMAANALRESASRTAASRIELLESQCKTATSGSETVRNIESAWSVTRIDPSRVTLVESVTYMSPRGRHADGYSAMVPCRQ